MNVKMPRLLTFQNKINNILTSQTIIIAFYD